MGVDSAGRALDNRWLGNATLGEARAPLVSHIEVREPPTKQWKLPVALAAVGAVCILGVVAYTLTAGDDALLAEEARQPAGATPLRARTIAPSSDSKASSAQPEPGVLQDAPSATPSTPPRSPYPRTPRSSSGDLPLPEGADY